MAGYKRILLKLSGEVLAGGAAFGPFISRNLTRVPAIRTLEQFKDLMHNGTDYRSPDSPPNTPILQVMPWPVYGKMTDRELEAIYEFLRAIPVINPRPASCVAWRSSWSWQPEAPVRSSGSGGADRMSASWRTGPVSIRSTLMVLIVWPRSTVMREFSRTCRAELPITKERLEPGPVSIRSP